MITTCPEWTFGIPHRPKRLQGKDSCHLCGVAISGACPLCPDCLADEDEAYQDHKNTAASLQPQL